MPNLLDLPQCLVEHKGRIDDLQFVCVLDKQIDYTETMQSIEKKDCYAAVVDMVGVRYEKKDYLVWGKAVVLLGARCFEPVPYGRRVMLLEGTAFLTKPYSCCVEILKTYGNDLYCTKTLFRDINGVRSSSSSLAKAVEAIAAMNWDFNGYFSQLEVPNGYHPCSFDCQFPDVSPEQKFTYMSNGEYWKNQKMNDPLNIAENQPKSLVDKIVKKQNSRYLDSRDAIVPKTAAFLAISEKVEIARNNIIEQLHIINSSTNKKYPIEAAISQLYRQLKTYWRRQPSQESVTGRVLFKNVIESMYPEFKNRFENNKPLIDSAIDNNDLLEIWYSGQVPNNLSENVFYIVVAQDREEVYIGFIDYLLNLNGNLVAAYRYSHELDIDMYSMMLFNPYFLTYFDNRLTIEDLDKLTLFYRVDMKTPNILKLRDAAFVHNMMLDSSYPFVSENTIVKLDDLVSSIVSGTFVSSKTFKNIQMYGCLVSQKVMHNLKFFIKQDFEMKDLAVPKLGWRDKKVKGVIKYFLPFAKQESEKDVLINYVNANLGIPFEDEGITYMMDFSLAVKEVYIINRLYELQENGTKPLLPPDLVDKCIEGFEALKAEEWSMPNFKLEQEQVDAVKMLYNPIMCITGPAGSGKTTTAEAILFSMDSLIGIKEDNIMFCAPTGKAASRLKEVVKKPTRTINSLFGIGNESYELYDDSDIKKKSEIKVLVVDESSMINLELMYNMLRKISDNTRIIFMGDKEQLPPIGFGKPFTNMLSVLPCVVLEVTKRASANSGITKNAESMIYRSDTSNPEMLRDYEDFRLIPARTTDIQRLVSGIVNYHLGLAGPKRTPDTQQGKVVLQSVDVGISPDDIQVVTPVNKYEWGTRALNNMLQNTFNPKRNGELSVRFAKDYEIKKNEYGAYVRDNVTYIEYRVGDRVIHLENMSMAERYSYRYENCFTKIDKTMGVMNGDKGKIKGIYKGSELHFILSNGCADEDTAMMFSNGDDVIYVAVEYEDVDENSNPMTFIIFYKCDVVFSADANDYYTKTGVMTVDSFALSKLDLAYALTVHKIQGSQAKLIIGVLFGVGYSGFISRNLMYTEMTRAEQGIYLIGDVMGESSIIQKGRHYEQNRMRSTLLDKMFK